LNSRYLDKGKALFARIADGDGHAFAQIHELYKVRLLYYARRFPLEWHEAEDLVAEAFMGLWRSKHLIQSDIHIRNLLFMAVRNKAINLVTSRKRRESLLENFEAEQQEMDDTLSADLVETEMMELLNKAIKALPGECRRIFELSYHEELSPKDIAHQLNMNAATVRSQKRRAIQLIQQWIRKNAPAAGLILGGFFADFQILQKFLLLLCTLHLFIGNYLL
jgi:RNA polymerase sigma-70 factor (family 1)